MLKNIKKRTKENNETKKGKQIKKKEHYERKKGYTKNSIQFNSKTLFKDGEPMTKSFEFRVANHFTKDTHK